MRPAPDDQPESSALASLRRELREREELLRKAMLEKGEMLLRQLEEARVREFEAEEMATLDSVSRVLRHSAFQLRLAFELERSARCAEPLGLILLDLDDFGAFNQALGFEEGERALGYVGRALQSLWLARPAKRPPAVGRDAADTFGVILPGADEAELAFRAEDVRDLVARLPLGPPRLTASVGAAILPEREGPPAARTAAALLARARAALVRAQAKRNAVELSAASEEASLGTAV